VRQVEHLARARDAAGAPRYTALVLDNRGAGNSGTPRGPYATRAMAADVVALLDFVGWTRRRGVHIVGISLGGMIAQGAWRPPLSVSVCRCVRRADAGAGAEIAARVPERIASLVLAVTTAGGPIWSNFPPVRPRAHAQHRAG
jgi:pimeloyl-ACP methyl ester carboxylesterase